MNEKLVITNYDNFKNADFFINQYFKAEEMIKEVNDFFQSFYFSKLLTSKDLINIHPKSFGGEYNNICWTNKIVDWNLCDNCHAYELSKDFDNSYWKHSVEELEKIAQRVNENVKKCMITIYKMMNNKFDCYYVLTEDNILHEFIPVAAKDSIKVNFKSKQSDNIIIEGCYYEYSEYGAQWGKCEYSLYKIIKKIYINRYNNNVVKVIGERKKINGGEVGGKNYWSNHDHYCMSELDGGISTASFDHVKKSIKSHIEYETQHWKYDVKSADYLNELIQKLIRETKEKYGERYKNSYGEEITDNYISNHIDNYIKYYGILNKIGA